MVDTSIRDILVAVKCPRQRQMEVGLELEIVFGWSIDDLCQSVREPLTQVILTMNAHTRVWFSSMSKHLNMMQEQGMIIFWQKYHASQEEDPQDNHADVKASEEY
ncbi:hypothetical protein KSF_106620 [Reticulibacter mediterranei]|uniref:Uncharacterized protein n=1 Tax=Reticulibacter mediterranei TaxID=2778369 RepID=A0A8J3N6Y1_9CHLR|nr:hypothetical protein [Reticulibacter mediterranei]GHP00615.1 hypothetical protein KSF_106620 [Reticulibacter mediterranei]